MAIRINECVGVDLQWWRTRRLRRNPDRQNSHEQDTPVHAEIVTQRRDTCLDRYTTLTSGSRAGHVATLRVVETGKRTEIRGV